MLLYRVFPYDKRARDGESGSPSYLHRPQGAGRWDNPALYDAWYLAKSPEGAVGETFGNLARWSPDMFRHPSGLTRALATFAVPDDLSLFDFDDAKNLMHIGMRPSQVVIRNKGLTQMRAAQLFHERTPDGTRAWRGLSWWSFHRPIWTNTVLWASADTPLLLTLANVETLTLSSPAVQEAATALSRPLP